MKILVVDDEKLLVKGITFNLENEGYEVTAAYDGDAAVELAKKEDFDLIILDLMMPVLSGTEACMKIREFSDVPIIMLTARSEDADKLMGFACGADDPYLELKGMLRGFAATSCAGKVFRPVLEKWVEDRRLGRKLPPFDEVEKILKKREGQEGIYRALRSVADYKIEL